MLEPPEPTELRALLSKVARAVRCQPYEVMMELGFELLNLRKGAEALLKECGCTWRLTATSFVFASHQGYQWLTACVADEVGSNRRS